MKNKDDEQIKFAFTNEYESEEQANEEQLETVTKKAKTLKSDIEVLNKLHQMIRILFDLRNLSTDDSSLFKKNFNEHIYRLQELNRELNYIYKNELMFTNDVEMFRELMLPLKDHRFFKKIANTMPELKAIANVPIYFNGSINPMLLSHSKDKDSYMKLVLDETRAYHDEEKALLLYGAIRSALDKGSYLESNILRTTRMIEKLNKDGIVSRSPHEMFTVGNESFTSFYKPYEKSLQKEVMVCSFCGSVGKIDSRGIYKCRGEAFCSHYRDKSLPPFIKVKIPEGDLLYVIQDVYYELITLPNLFEKITLNKLLEKLPKDKYIISLYPGIDREGDIKVTSKITERVYIIDCKKYKTILTLVKYELSNLSTLRKIKTLDKNQEFMFVVPGEIAKLSNINYVRNNKSFNKFGALIFSEDEVVDYILKQEKKYMTEKEV